MQAALQEYVCMSISKTINLPSSASVEDVLDAYVLAYELECKGLTVYRNGSRQNQVLTMGQEKQRPLEVKPPNESEGTIYVCKSCGFKMHTFSGACVICPKCGLKECSD